MASDGRQLVSKRASDLHLASAGVGLGLANCEPRAQLADPQAGEDEVREHCAALDVPMQRPADRSAVICPAVSK
jgi:hypothetical protein